MPDQVFRYAGPAGSVAPYGDPFTVKESWPAWQKQVWINALAESGYGPQQSSWTPTYESGSVSWPGNDGVMQSAALDEYECPTKATADHLAALYGVNGQPLHVLEFPFVGAGPVASSAVTRLLQWPNFATLPVKQLAMYYTLNPEDKFPHVADNLCKLLIAQVWHG